MLERPFQSNDTSMRPSILTCQASYPAFGSMALPQSSLLGILASLSLYLEAGSNSFSSEPPSLHTFANTDPPDTSTPSFLTGFLHSVHFQLSATFSLWPRWASDFCSSFSLPSSFSISIQVNLFDYMRCIAAMLRHQLSSHSEAWRKDYH